MNTKRGYYIPPTVPDGYERVLKGDTITHDCLVYSYTENRFKSREQWKTWKALYGQKVILDQFVIKKIDIANANKVSSNELEKRMDKESFLNELHKLM